MFRVSIVCTLVCMVVACGRFRFELGDTTSDGSIGGGDGSTPDAPGLPLIHQYSFAGNLDDDLGGPPLAGLGGMLVAGGYQFAPNEGVSLTNAIPPAGYSIDMTFDLTTVVGYRKVLDFKALGSDAGVYAFDNQLQYVVVPITGCPGNSCYTSPVLLADNVTVQITITRSAAGMAAGYVDKVMQFEFDDSGSVGVFDASPSVANFFVDDTVTSGNEAAPGIVHRIRIYDGALSPADVTRL